MKTILFLLSCFPLGAMAGQVLVLLEPGFNADEFYAPAAVLRAAGHAVDIASSRTNAVPLRLDLAPSPGLDVKVDLAIAAVDPTRYDALFVPGGHSPAFLEKDPDAVRVVKAFLDAGKPVAMICHAPRILLSHDLLGQRAFTCLHKVADEIPETWRRHAGRYLDRPVVLDRNLLTSRYPLDAPVFAWNMLKLFDAAEHRATTARAGTVAFVIRPHEDPRMQRHFIGRLGSALGSFGASLRSANATDAAGVEKLLREPFEVLAVDFSAAEWDLLPESSREGVRTAPRLVAAESMREILRDRKAPTQWVQDRELTAWTDALVKVLPEAAEHPAPGDARVPSISAALEIRMTDDPAAARAVLALRDGYDDEAYAAWLRVLKESGREPLLLVAENAGEVRGVNGVLANASHAYAGLSLASDVWVVAPGFFAARGESDAAREDWLLAAREAGATLFLTGLDTLGVGSRPDFKGKSFTGSEQTVWSFPKEGARYRNDPALLSDERLVTVRSAGDVPAAPERLSHSQPMAVP
jgi:protease I